MQLFDHTWRAGADFKFDRVVIIQPPINRAGLSVERVGEGEVRLVVWIRLACIEVDRFHDRISAVTWAGGEFRAAVEVPEAGGFDDDGLEALQDGGRRQIDGEAANSDDARMACGALALVQEGDRFGEVSAAWEWAGGVGFVVNPCIGRLDDIG